MTKNELIAENKWLRERAEKAEAALAHTEEAARMYCGRTMAAEERMQKAAARAAAAWAAWAASEATAMAAAGAAARAAWAAMAASEAAARAAWDAAWDRLVEILKAWCKEQEVRR